MKIGGISRKKGKKDRKLHILLNNKKRGIYGI
jgi:hypothetical protein